MPSNTNRQAAEHVKGRQTRASWIVSELRAKIIAGDLLPNSKLNLVQLRDGFEISLSPLREAISRLVAEGLVKLEDQRGFRVAPISIENLTEITLLRAELDTLALKQSIMNTNLDWEAAVTGAIYRLVQAGADANSKNSQTAWMVALSDFFSYLLCGGNTPQLNQYCRHLRHQMDRYILLLDVFDPQECRKKAAEYKAVADAAIACDEPLASALLSAQIRRDGNKLAHALKVHMAQTQAKSKSSHVHTA